MSDETSAAIAERVVNERAKSGDSYLTWDELSANTRDRLIALVDAGRAAASSDLDAAVEAAMKATAPKALKDAANAGAREALTKLSAECWTHGKMHPDATPFDVMIMRFRDREYPAPVPEPPHVMVNGWRVTYHKGEKFEYVATRGTCEHLYLNAVRLCEAKSMTDEADTDVVRVLALREGRGDGHADAK